MPALRRLFKEVVPKRLTLFAAQPQLAAQLSNATENALAPDIFIDTLLALPELDANTLLEAGAVIAWRLGDARVRTAALPLLARLPARAVLVALGHSDWPDSSAAVLVAQLQADAWRVHFSQPLTAVASPKLDYGTVSVLAHFGEFTGFGGVFDTPPRLLRGDDPHLFLVRCGGQGFAITADGFGAHIRGTSELAPDHTADPAPSIPPPPILAGYNWQVHAHVLIAASPISHRLSVLG